MAAFAGGIIQVAIAAKLPIDKKASGMYPIKDATIV